MQGRTRTLIIKALERGLLSSFWPRVLLSRLVLVFLLTASLNLNQAKLQRNLMYLAAIADSQPQPPIMHSQGKLTDGTVFNSIFERGDPIEFELGWDHGLLGMCMGEKRKLKIPAKIGYGAQGSPPTIPGLCDKN
ncbi:uncharacterized protein LOC141707701 isoform X2 [Apium graveolens]|uniref:uncharacterized protein LOC141707701 isoform X2 n=1 Tax=Apium graveolens TaxID=4045 RepID=UPI003D79015B